MFGALKRLFGVGKPARASLISDAELLGMFTALSSMPREVPRKKWMEVYRDARGTKGKVHGLGPDECFELVREACREDPASFYPPHDVHGYCSGFITGLQMDGEALDAARAALNVIVMLSDRADFDEWEQAIAKSGLSEEEWQRREEKKVPDAVRKVAARLQRQR